MKSMSYTNYLEKKLLDYLFSKASYTQPTIYVGLSTADPGEDASTLAEPSGSGYARVATVAGDWNAATLGVGTLTNANSITFPTATGSWGTVTYVCLFDAASGTNLLGSGALTSGTSVSSGEIATFAAGAITVSLA